MGINPIIGFAFQSDNFTININGNDCHYTNKNLNVLNFKQIALGEVFKVFYIDGKYLGEYSKEEILNFGKGVYILKNEKRVYKILY